ncbi:hypothetical protein DFR48_10193 [Ciceribacter lividus]|uniref:Uncharacterized protein n=1 Tax=Ciceribacter lividus TaxID=1197950 RepID=A0A6I7HTF4_9HYPH|nr:hypothetical protein [Ciceribacter lividus]RCW28085.1 hypothetical protein DFR48_10193 [Ciceribacter lividus]
MNDMLSLVLNSVNLDGYGSSPGFVGYFEKAAKYKPGMAEVVADFFCEFFAEWLHDVAMVSSLHINADQVGHSGDVLDDERNLALVKSPMSAGLIRRLSYNDEFGHDYGSALYEAAIEGIWTNFKVFRIGKYQPVVFRNLLICRLLVYGVHGHCFLVVEKLGLACYPTDDVGFGVVALGDDADIPAAREFLRRAGALEGFRAAIEK